MCNRIFLRKYFIFWKSNKLFKNIILNYIILYKNYIIHTKEILLTNIVNNDSHKNCKYKIFNHFMLKNLWQSRSNGTGKEHRTTVFRSCNIDNESKTKSCLHFARLLYK